MQSNLNSNLKKISEKEKVIQTLESCYKTCSGQLDYTLIELEQTKATAQTQETRIIQLESELSQVKEKLVDTECSYSDAQRGFTETTEHDHSDLENLRRDFDSTEATLREKLAKIAEVEAALAALTAENSVLAQQNFTDACALEDSRGKYIVLEQELEQRDDRISELTG
jgi:chromosome segregation ATPase